MGLCTQPTPSFKNLRCFQQQRQTATAERFRPNPDALGASVHATLESKSLALQREIEPGRARSPAIQRCLEFQTARSELWIFKPYPGLLTKTAGIYGCSSPHISPFGISIRGTSESSVAPSSAAPAEVISGDQCRGAMGAHGVPWEITVNG